MCVYLRNQTRPLGKFEGEWCGTLFAYWVVTNGFGDPCEEDEDCAVVSVPIIPGDIASFNADNPDNPICSECEKELLEQKESLHLCEDSNGFAYTL